MASIQTSPHPLVYPVAELPAGFQATASKPDSGRLRLRTTARSLEGMQKEAIVHYGSTGRAWRMVCDEGPYLNGTDLAPFPLAFFCTGMVCSYMSELIRLLDERRISYRNLKLIQDNRYGMEGSALAGTMTGSALPVELQLVVDSTATAAALQQALMDAVAASPAAALLGGSYVSEFSITHNGNRLEPVRVTETKAKVPPAPEGFDELEPESAPFVEHIISKLHAAEVRHGVSGGAGSSLNENQKRELHMQGVCRLREDGLKEVEVQLYNPIGSQFRFLSDDSKAFGGAERAPGGLAYLSAGLAFCYMTQIGRYAAIRKQPLDGYTIVQDTCFTRADSAKAGKKTTKAPAMKPVVTHVFLDSTHDDDYAGTVVDMSEQTCFLHAACRDEVRVKLRELSRSIPIVP